MLFIKKEERHCKFYKKIYNIIFTQSFTSIRLQCFEIGSKRVKNMMNKVDSPLSIRFHLRNRNHFRCPWPSVWRQVVGAPWWSVPVAAAAEAVRC